MKKTNIFLILLSVALVVSSCKKEEVARLQSDTEKENANRTRHISYWVDDNHFSKTLRNETDLAVFLQELNNLAFQGRLIRISDDDAETSGASAKQEEKIDTKDIAEFDEWKAEMLDRGYVVQYYYDDETGYFHGIATKK